MAALSYLRGAGLIVEAVAGRLRVSPVERITPELRQYIATHKAELLAALEVANDHQAGTWLHQHSVMVAPADTAQKAGSPQPGQRWVLHWLLHWFHWQGGGPGRRVAGALRLRHAARPAVRVHRAARP